MSALPLTVDVEPVSGAGSDPAVDGRATVVPLIRRVDRHERTGREPVVLRHRLFQRLAAADALTVVSAPAGSGKTSLLRSWIADAGLAEHAGWSTVPRDERDGQRFWRSVRDALAGVAGGGALASRAGLAVGGGSEVLVERLLSDLRSLREPAVLVIDDLHELHSDDALASLERFLTRLPEQLRVVLLTRAAPRLGLHRLRLTGALTELRAEDLCFSVQEARELLEASGIVLSDAAVASLHERTEGWAAGLRLAAGSLAGHPDPEAFVSEFCGTERTVAGYLVAEVLERQPPEVRDLLLRTSVLERISGPLADALTGGSGSERILHELETANMFVTTLDVGRSWFRYHPLFADLLRLELRRVNPTLIRSLHAAAARWHEQHGDVVEAIRHAQAAHDWPHAAGLLADNQLELILDGQTATVRALLDAFPADVATTDPELALAFALARLYEGLREEAAAHVAVAERLAAAVSDDRRRRFELGLAVATLWSARVGGDLSRVPDASRRVEAALKAQRPSDVLGGQPNRATALLKLGIAQMWSLRSDDGRGHVEEALSLARRIGRPYLEMACLGHLALAAPVSGEPLAVGRRLAEEAVAIAEANGWDTHRNAAPSFAAAGTALAWLGRFPEAERCLDRAERALAPGGAPEIELLVNKGRGLVRLGQRRLDDALAAFRAAERMQGALGSEHPLMLDLSSRKLRTQIELGETAAVRAALAGLPPEARGRAEMRIAAAAAELAEGRAEEAVDELVPVVERSVRAFHPGTMIEALLLDAVAREQLGDRAAAAASLERALALAEPDGILLPFALVGVCELLERHGGHRTTHSSLRAMVLDMLAGASPPPELEPLRDPLSDAELRVLRYLPSNLKATEIAAELCVSSNTVRTHLRHVYAKLDAHSRSEAVSRARLMGLLAPARA
jgi:LuxR family transcriptional regulator, maltose regulon positive regulatory protein